MELIKLAVTKRSRLSDVMHAALNALYAALLFVLVIPEVDLPLIALALVLLGKWRVIAVRPRFWFANFQANFVDFMVGISVWALMVLTAASTPWVAAMLAVFFGFWLIVIKPHSSQNWVVIQAGVAQFVSLVALFSYAHHFEYGQIWRDSTFLTVALAWVIGYMSARHTLSAFRGEEERALLSLIWGFVVAELAWLFHHWTIAYALYRLETVRSDEQLMVPQAAIIITLLAVIAVRAYSVLHREEGSRNLKELRSLIVFSATTIVVLLLFFSGLVDITSL